MKKNLPAVFLILFLSFAITSCEIINPAEPVPSYLHFDNIVLQTDTTTQGSSSNKITDVWLYVDNQLLGAYEMPVTIPVLKEGSHEIKVRGGIIVNGIAATRVYYPFYTFYVDTINLTSASVTTVNPVVTYLSGTVFSLNESFSGTGNQLVSTPQSDTAIQRISDSLHAFENETAKVILDAQHPVFECASFDSLTLPADGNPVYMEINYKTNTEFTVGVYAYTSLGVFNTSVLTIRANTEWKKIYINLSDATSLYPTASGFKPYINMERNSSVGDAELYFDNVKVVNF